MNDPIEKIQRLLERAAHEATPVEEARTSGVIAAKLIIEHKVELRMPGGARVFAPDVKDVVDDFLSSLWRPQRRRRGGYHDSAPPQEGGRRQIFHALCPDLLTLKCTCCGAPVRVGTQICWVSREALVDDDTVARVVHGSCIQHWQQRVCATCGKNTHKSVREKLVNQRRDPPGTVRATQAGTCTCCGGSFAVGEKIVQRFLSCTHMRCYPHFVKSPCPRCGREAGF